MRSPMPPPQSTSWRQLYSRQPAHPPASIQSTVDQFRAALGVVNNGNNPSQPSGRREINWDGGSPTNSTTTLSGTPLTAFLNTRGANITTRGSGFVQAPRLAWRIPLGIRVTPRSFTRLVRFDSSRRLEATSPKWSSLFQARNGNTPATTTGFGVVFTDVDSPDGSGPGNRTETVTPAL